MLQILQGNRFFFIPFLLFLIAGALVIGAYPKGAIVLYLNEKHTVFFDNLFYYLTLIGNGWFYIAVIIALCFVRYYYALLGLFSYITSAIISQGLKHIVFTSFERPKEFFKGIQDLHFAENIEIHSSFSFPSGHSVTAFSLFLLLSLLIKNKHLGIIFLLLSLLIATSRIYLAQHFFIDTYAGSIIGVVITLFCYQLMERSKIIQQLHWKDKSLLNKSNKSLI